MESREEKKYLSLAGAWTLAFGCSVGWGSFVMPGTTFLPVAGPVGTAIGIAAGALVMMILGLNYHYLMNRFSGGGGTYTYTKMCFGYDHGFLSAWFLIITYIAVIWANATALPLIARTLLGGIFQFGFHYQIAGYDVYMGEVFMAVAALCIAAGLCLRRKLAERVQILMAILLFAGVLICFVGALLSGGSRNMVSPPFSPENSGFGGVVTIFALAPWAFVGFESISHSTGEAAYPLKKTFHVILAALVTGALAYIMLAFLAASALPEGCGTWVDYIGSLGSRSGISSLPTFFGAWTSLGNAGSVLLGVTALCGIFTGLIGNYIALSRLLAAMTEDGMLPGWFGKSNKDHVPGNAILLISLISIVLPFFGRTAISWIVDVTTVGATIAYAFASASAWKCAKDEENRRMSAVGMAGIVVSVLFALEFLIPNITSVKTLSTESYLILAAWGILGFAYFWLVLRQDKERRWGRSTVTWMVLLGLIIFTSSIWADQSAQKAVKDSVEPIHRYYTEGDGEGADGEIADMDFLNQELQRIDRSLDLSNTILVILIVTALGFLLSIYSLIQKRERQTEIEKALAEESSQAKTSFLSNMSHEIRTPMNAIIGLDNIALKNPNLTPKTREQLEKIGSSAKHLLGLINDILDMSRIESGRMVLKNEEFSLQEFLDQVNVIIHGQCVDKGLQYECAIIGRVYDYYFGDDMKLKQILINILGNSVKFTEPPGKVSLTVECLQEENGQSKMRFMMKDTGIGMDKDYLPKIFEAFSQEDETSTNKYGGSGLGMAITKNFVEMMGGTIHVDSEKGVGSVFSVTVDLECSLRSGHDEHGTLPPDFRIILVDDDAVALEHAQLVLEDIGIKSTVTTEPEEALTLMRQAKEEGREYHLLLTDYKMASMNGLELTRRMHEFDDHKTAVIMLTGYNWEIIENDAEKAGIDDILAKPIFADMLVRKILNVLKKRAEAENPDAAEEQEETLSVESVLAGRRVLMAEDVEQNAEILADLLDLEDVAAEHALNGQMAVDMFSEKPSGYYDAILMDVRMPVMDGLTATRTIRALDHPDAQTIPIIAMTANVFDEDVEKCLEAGMNTHLAKPIEPELLFLELAKLIENRNE